jgi:hypothetical protein
MPNLPRFAASLVLFLGTASLTAQCIPTFSALAGLRGFDGAVRASLRWDPDGPGPLGERLVIAGDFRMVGRTAANGIVAWDPATGTWTPFGTGMTSVTSLAVLPNGQLVAGGGFATAGGVAANFIARWTGSAWAPLGAGFDSTVLSLCVRPNGDLIAGGGFIYSGTVQVGGIARWNGSTWSAIGTGTNAAVQALATLPNGDVVAGGWFTLMNGVSVNRLARWNGSTWSAFAGGIGGEVHMLRVLQNGDVLAGGQFSSVGGVPAQNVARWNGTTWAPLGPGIPGGWNTHVRCATELANGDLVVGGQFDPNYGAPGVNIARWNGSTWSPLGTGVSGPTWSNTIASLTVTALADGSTFAGGTFQTAGGTNVNHAARWDGTSWLLLQQGIDNYVMCSVVLPNGDVVFGGSFTTIDNQSFQRIARWDGTTFHALGSGLNYNPADMVVDVNGDLIVVGSFTVAGDVPAQSIARWNGTTWSAMDQGIDLTWGVSSIARLPNGDLWCAGYPHAASGLSRWNGSAWTPYVNGPNHFISDLAAMPNGDLVVTGNFTAVGAVAANYIARYDGSQWHPLGSGFDWLGRSLLVTRTGSLVALGMFATAGGVASQGIARWNGTSWHGLGGGLGSWNGSGNEGVVARELPNGDLLVGGDFGTAGGVLARRLARWNGTSWSAVADADNYVFTMAQRPDGTMFVGGWFLTLGNVVAPFMARLTSPCAASATSLGGGCASSGGANTLVARTLPWTGSTFLADASGLPTSALVVAVTGLSAASLPLPSVLPTGQLGCTLLASPDLTSVLVVGNGTAQSSLALPNQPSLAGITLRHQLVPFEILPGPALGAATATNVLTLTVGAF